MRRSAPIAVATSCTFAPDRLAQIGDLVDEADLHREEGVGGIFGKFRRFAAHEHNRRVAQGERLDRAAPSARVRARSSQPISTRSGCMKSLDGRAFAQEFGIGADREVGIRPELREPPLDLAAGADRHRRFGADDGEAP